MLLKQHFKTFILEKFTRQGGSKQAILKQEKLNFKATAIRLSCNIYDFAGQLISENEEISKLV